MSSIHSLYTTLTTKIARVRRAEQSLSLQTGVINALAGLIAVWTFAGVMELLFEFDIPGRTVLFWSSALLSLAILGKCLVEPLGRLIGILSKQNDETIARRVGLKIPQVGDRLVNTLQLYRTVVAGAGAGTSVGYAPGVSVELAEASVVAQGGPLVDYDYSVILEKEDRRRALLLLFSAALLFGALFFTFGDNLAHAYTRLANYSTHYQKPAPFALAMEPGDLRVVKGDSVEIFVRATGIPPRTVTLTLQEGEGGPEEYELREVEPGLYRHLLPSIRRNTAYQAEAAGVMTEAYNISVVERPEIRQMIVTVNPPRYTGRRSETLPDGYGDVSGLRGTGVGISLETSIPVARAEIVQLFPKGGSATTLPVSVEATGSQMPAMAYDTLRVPMGVTGTSIRGGFSLRRSGEYYISITSPEGLQNLSPIHYTMSVSTDASPSITLLQPTSEVELDETMLLPTQLRIGDDYGFSKLRIMYRLTASKYEQPWEKFREAVIPIPAGDPSSIDVPYLWDMTKSRLVPEDELEIYFEVLDNDVVSGPKSARTGTISVRFPSLEEIYMEAEQVQDKATADLENLMKEAEQARRDMEQLDRELSKQLAQQKHEADWQEKQKLQDIIKKHEQMQAKMEQLAEDLQTMAEKLQESKAISPETLQKYQELQKLFEEVKNPEMMKSMQQLQEQMDKMTPEEMAEAMRNYKFNEEQFKQAMERTKKILERMKTQQQMDELVQRSEQLSKKQQELNQDMAQTNPNDKGARENLAKQQQELADQAKRMQERAKELSEQMKGQQNMPSEQMEGAQQQLQQNNPSQQMQQGSQQMQKGNQQGAQQSGQQAQQGLEQFNQQMQQMQQQMRENEQRQVVNKMKKSLKDLLDLSKKQEELREQTDQATPNSPAFRDLARQQSELKQDMANLSNQMMQMGEQSSAVTPEMGRELGNAMREMGEAQGSLEERNGYSASRQQGEAMGSMNEAAMMMAQQLGQMQGQQGQQGQGQGMGSFQQRLQQLAAQQQMINMAMGQQQGGEQQGQQGQGKQGKNGEGQGEGEGGEENGGGKGVAQRLTRQQQEVKKSLEELNKEAKESGGTRKNMVGDLERAAKEIEEVLRDMQSGKITEQTLRRQEQILSRMLDAMKSQRERDFERKRESTPGKDVLRDSPPGLRLGNGQTPLDGSGTNPDQGMQGYSRDYEYLIRKYFEAVGR